MSNLAILDVDKCLELIRKIAEDYCACDGYDCKPRHVCGHERAERFLRQTSAWKYVPPSPYRSLARGQKQGRK